MPPSRFGHRVVGAEQAATDETRAIVGAEKFGTRVRGRREDDAPEADRRPPVPTNGKGSRTGVKAPGEELSMSVEDVDNTLEGNPSFLPGLYEAELARPDGPRKAALKIFKATLDARIPGTRGYDDHTALKIHKELCDLLEIVALPPVEEESVLANQPVNKTAPEIEDTVRQGHELDDKGADLSLVTDGEGSKTDAPAGKSATDEEFDNMTVAELNEVAPALGVDVEKIEGTGADGRVIKADILAAVKKAAKENGL